MLTIETYDVIEGGGEAEIETYELAVVNKDIGVLLHPAAVSRTRETYIKRMIFDKLCDAVASPAAVQKKLFMMYHEVERGPYLLAYRYNQIFRYVISCLNTK
jgi:hypothetical protein